MSSFKQQVFFVFSTCASVLLILEVGLATANVEHRESESVIGITKLPEEVTIEDNSTITSEFPSNLNNTTFPATSNQSTADEVSFTPNITSTETDGFGNSSKLTTVVGNNTNVNVTTFAPTSYNVSLSTVSAVMSNVTGNATATYNATTINVENDTEAGSLFFYSFMLLVICILILAAILCCCSNGAGEKGPQSSAVDGVLGDHPTGWVRNDDQRMPHWPQVQPVSPYVAPTAY